MSHVVYLLGAGFSAPLGLPVMRDFLIKSKDMFAIHPKHYASFRKVFTLIDHMGSIQSYYQADLFNIEEILPPTSTFGLPTMSLASPQLHSLAPTLVTLL